MNKRKNKGAAHPQQSFQQMVADATLNKFSYYIDSEIAQAIQSMRGVIAQNIQNLTTRLRATEQILMELNPSITKEVLTNRIAAIQDETDGLASIGNEPVQRGDRVRIEVKTRTADQTEYQGSSRLQVENVGDGKSLGKELEEAIIGMVASEVKEVKFGKDDGIVASIELNSASRALEKLAATPDQTQEVLSAPETNSQEDTNASTNAG